VHESRPRCRPSHPGSLPKRLDPIAAAWSRGVSRPRRRLPKGTVGKRERRGLYSFSLGRPGRRPQGGTAGSADTAGPWFEVTPPFPSACRGRASCCAWAGHP